MRLDPSSGLCILSLSCLIVLSHTVNLLPENEARPDGVVRLRDTRRNMELSEPLARRVADIMLNKNFSLLIEFALDEQTRGTLFSVYGGPSKVFELYAEGLRGELRVHWRRETSLASLHIKHVYDRRWQRILLSMEGWRLRLLVDCKEVVAGDYPEIDFSLLSSSRPQIWMGQRNKHQSFFQGGFRHFEIEPTTALVRQYCGWRAETGHGKDHPSSRSISVHSATTTSPVLPSGQHPSGNGAEAATVEELKTKIRSLEDTLNTFVYYLLGPGNGTGSMSNGSKENVTLIRNQGATPTAPTAMTDGICPDCYEYLRFKVNHLEDELRNWREKLEKMEKNVQRIMLIQRGCQVNTSTIVEEGSTWSNNDTCTECVCTLGKVLCKPIGCAPLSSTCTGRRPHILPGQCCPERCGRPCLYMGRAYDHGHVFWPKECVRCTCDDGDVSCAYRTDQCPQLSCTIDRQYKHENHCCPVCENEDFCALHPCHPNATCTNRRADRECQCKPGFFGDGERCFDVDECRWDKNVAEQLGGCGPGTRCINTPGSFYCECLPGYAKLNERTCLDMIIL